MYTVKLVSVLVLISLKIILPGQASNMAAMTTFFVRFYNILSGSLFKD